jgi:hypothetical protein
VVLPLERLQEQGFIGFNDSAFARGLVLGSLLQKAMTPEDGCVLFLSIRQRRAAARTLTPSIKAWP